MGNIVIPSSPVAGLDQETRDLIMSRMFPGDSPYARNPIKWVRERLNEHMWSAQRAIARSVVKNRYTAVHSAHDTGKSFTASRICSWWIDSHPPGQAFAVTTAPTTHQVDAILWREIGRAHRKGNLPGRITLDSKWRLGSNYGDELVAYGRKPADYDPEAFQGIHQRYILVIIDEANGVPKVLFDAINTIVTNEHARVLAIGNPDSPTSHFAHICRPESDWRKIHISAFDTPNFTGEWLPDARIYEDLISPRWVEERAKEWGVNSPLYISKVLGMFPVMADDSLIQEDWWNAAAERDLDPHGWTGQLGIDVARYGSDKSVCYRQRGGHLRKEWELAKSSTTDTARKAAGTLAKHRHVPVTVDGTGLGAGVVDTLKDWGYNVWDFISSEAPSDNRFADRRSEAYWHMRELFEHGLVDVDPDALKLKNQLISMKWGLDRKGRIKVESKADYMKRLGVSSPDEADGAMMACWEHKVNIPLNHSDVPAITSDLLEVAW